MIFTSTTYGNSFSTLRLFRRCRDDFPRGQKCIDFSDLAKHNWIHGRDTLLDESRTKIDFFSAIVCGCGRDFCNENATRVLGMISEQVADWERSLHEDDDGGEGGDEGGEFVRGQSAAERPLLTKKVTMTICFGSILFVKIFLKILK